MPQLMGRKSAEIVRNANLKDTEKSSQPRIEPATAFTKEKRRPNRKLNIKLNLQHIQHVVNLSAIARRVHGKFNCL